MFIELMEILEENLYSNKEPARLISVNPVKIQAFFPDERGTVVQFRRGSMKVKEDYETVKSLIALSESITKTKKKT